MGRGDWFVGARSDPGLRGFAMAALLKALHEFAESAAQNPASTGTGETPAQLAEQPADSATWSSASGRTLPSAPRRTLPDTAKHFGDLVPVLVARDREQ